MTGALAHSMDSRYVFISHSRVNRAIALKICDHLAASGVAHWIDKERLQAGQTFPTELADAVGGCAALLLLVSAESMASEWVKDEMHLARTLGKPIIPVFIEKMSLSNEMTLLIGRKQQINAFPGPIEDYLADISKQVAARLEVALRDAGRVRVPWRRRPMVRYGTPVAVVVLLVLAFYAYQRAAEDAALPPEVRPVQLRIEYWTEGKTFRPLPYDKAGLADGTSMSLSPEHIPGASSYLLAPGESHGPCVIEWKEGGPAEMSISSDNSWAWAAAQSGSMTLMQIVTPKPLTEQQRQELSAAVIALGHAPDLKPEQQIVWWAGQWKMLRKGKVERDPTYDATWADGLVALLKARSIDFDGRSIFVAGK